MDQLKFVFWMGKGYYPYYVISRLQFYLFILYMNIFGLENTFIFWFQNIILASLTYLKPKSNHNQALPLLAIWKYKLLGTEEGEAVAGEQSAKSFGHFANSFSDSIKSNNLCLAKLTGHVSGGQAMCEESPGSRRLGAQSTVKSLGWP